MKENHRMLRIFFILFFSCAFCTLQAQTQTPKYTVHTVAKGETLSLLAQKNHTTVGDIMRLNSMNANSQLKVGQKIKIPAGTTTTATKTTATKTTPAKTSKQASSGGGIETHYVLQGETLYGISKKFGVSVDELKQWNNLNDDNIHFGQKLIVKGEQAPPTITTVAQQQPDSTPTVKEETANDNSAQNTKPVADTTSLVEANKASETTESSNNSSNNAIVFSTASVSATTEGYFGKDFKATDIKKINGNAMTFQSASGWGDKKYYILANGIASGSIVKVSAANGKSVYAKVLWSLDAKGNNGLSFRLSDAAAFALGVSDSSFNLTVEY